MVYIIYNGRMSNLLSRKNKFYVSPCKHKWCMDCNLNQNFLENVLIVEYVFHYHQNLKRKWKEMNV